MTAADKKAKKKTVNGDNTKLESADNTNTGFMRYNSSDDEATTPKSPPPVQKDLTFGIVETVVDDQTTQNSKRSRPVPDSEDIVTVDDVSESLLQAAIDERDSCAEKLRQLSSRHAKLEEELEATKKDLDEDGNRFIDEGLAYEETITNKNNELADSTPR